MREPLYVVCLTLLLTSNVLAKDANAVKVDSLSKTGSSWDGRVHPDCPNDNAGINAGVLLNGEWTVVTEDNG